MEKIAAENPFFGHLLHIDLFHNPPNWDPSVAIIIYIVGVFLLHSKRFK